MPWPLSVVTIRSLQSIDDDAAAIKANLLRDGGAKPKGLYRRGSRVAEQRRGSTQRTLRPNRWERERMLPRRLRPSNLHSYPEPLLGFKRAKVVMRRATLLFTVMAVALLAAPAGVAIGQAQTMTESERTPVSFSLTNPCNGETVDFSGIAHLVSHATTDDTGGIHEMFELNLQASGTGTQSGARYQISEGTSGVASSSATGAEEFTFPTRLLVIGEGTAPNFVAHTVAHVTLNANGEFTVFFVHEKGECKG
jgi:hypothetical protein